MPHTNKGPSRREEEHSLFPYVCRLLNNTSTNHNKYVVNQTLEHESAVYTIIPHPLQFHLACLNATSGKFRYHMTCTMYSSNNLKITEILKTTNHIMNQIESKSRYIPAVIAFLIE